MLRRQVFVVFADVRESDNNLPGVVTDGEFDIDVLKSALRRFRNRALLRILWREIFGLADLDETLAQLTRLADLMLDVAARCAAQSLEPRFGAVRDSAGQAVPLVILGMEAGGSRTQFLVGYRPDLPVYAGWRNQWRQDSECAGVLRATDASDHRPDRRSNG